MGQYRRQDGDVISDVREHTETKAYRFSKSVAFGQTETLIAFTPIRLTKVFGFFAQGPNDAEIIMSIDGVQYASPPINTLNRYVHLSFVRGIEIPKGKEFKLQVKDLRDSGPNATFTGFLEAEGDVDVV